MVQAMASRLLTISAKNIASSQVLHFDYFPHVVGIPDYKIIIPSFDRPVKLCKSTLSLLSSQGISLNKVHVFVSPGSASTSTMPEWQRYHEALREHGFLEVHLHEGGIGLSCNMMAALKFVKCGYVITMSDHVLDIQEQTQRVDGSMCLSSIPTGGLHAIIQHGYQMLMAGKFAVWGVSPSHSPNRLRPDVISRRLGLVDGNLCGMLLPSDWNLFSIASKYDLIYDVAWSTKLWDNGYRLVRYSGVCVKHPYRASGGQNSVIPSKTKRRRAENKAIKMLQCEHPSLIEFIKKPNASLKNMQYRFLRHGPLPMRMIQCPGVRLSKTRFLHRPMTTSERQLKRRGQLVITGVGKTVKGSARSSSS